MWYIAFLGLAGVVVAVGGVVWRKHHRRAESEALVEAEPAFLHEVRTLVESRRYGEAATLQLEHDNTEEAYNLLVRGELFARASELAEAQGWTHKAARHAEEAHNFARAARLYEEVREIERASQMYAQAGDLRRAQELLASRPEIRLQERAVLWERALMTLLKCQPPGQESPGAVETMTRLGELASEAFRELGDVENAHRLQSLADKEVEARQLRRYNASPSPSRSVGFDDRCEPPWPASPVSRAASALPTSSAPSGSRAAFASPSTPAASAPSFSQESGFSGASASRTPLSSTSSSLPYSLPGESVASAGAPIRVVSRAHQGFSVYGQEIASAAFSHTETQAPLVYVKDALTQVVQPVRQESERYRLGRKIATGGMAVVYEAFDNQMQRKVAIKFLPPSLSSSEQALSMFAREARIAYSLHHPNIVEVFDYGVLDGCPYIAMELVEGATLQELMERGIDPRGLPLAEVLRVADELLAAMEYAHAQNLVHRDIKPSNVMCALDGSIKLMDFGVARQVDAANSVTIAGTPSYMSPEQVRGRGLDHRSDFFSFGVLLYTLLTRELPFEGFSREVVPPSPDLFRDIPQRLVSTVMWCLSFSAEERPQSATLLRQVCQHLALDLPPSETPLEDTNALVQATRCLQRSMVHSEEEPTQAVDSVEIKVPWDLPEDELPPSSFEREPSPLAPWGSPLASQGATPLAPKPTPHPVSHEPNLYTVAQSLAPSLQEQTTASLHAPPKKQASQDSLENLLADYLQDE